MQNLSDDELDNLFRKAAEELKPAYEPAHWKELDEKLTAGQKSTGNRGWMWAGIFALLLTGTLITFWTIDRNNSFEKIATTSSASNAVKPTNKESLTNVNVEKVNVDNTKGEVSTDISGVTKQDLSQPTPEIENATPHPTRRLAPDETSTSIRTVNDESITSPNSKSFTTSTQHNATTLLDIEKESDGRKTIVKVKPDQSAFQTINTGAGKSVAAADPKDPGASHEEETNLATTNITSPGKTNVAPLQSDLTSSSTQASNTPAAIEPISLPNAKRESISKSTNHKESEFVESDNKSVTADDQKALQAQLAEGNDEFKLTASQAAASDVQGDSVETVKRNTPDSIKTSLKEQEKEAVQNLPRLSLKVALSPDYSSVRYSSFTKSGTNYGILAEYRLSSRWSVAAGVLSSRKIYSAADLEYQGHKADKTDGDCRIIDIPLNVYYHFKPHHSVSFFAGVGISSYIMNSEEYTFFVKTYSGGYSYTRKIEGENNELFSVINISAGINKQLNPRWGIQLEPFVKQPFKGIGDGNLSLSSLGAFLNLRYTIIK